MLYIYRYVYTPGWSVRKPDRANAAMSCYGKRVLYRTPAGKDCCGANSVGADRSGWFRATVLAHEVQGNVAVVSFSLQFKDLMWNGMWNWKPIRWGYLGVMHGRHIHVSAISEDLMLAWHEHPDASALNDQDSVFRIRLALPAGRPQRVRLLFNFGLLADRRDVDMCVSESAVHVDPGPQMELTVEGNTESELLALQPMPITAGSDAEAGTNRPRLAPTYEERAAVVSVTMSKDTQADELLGHQPMIHSGSSAAPPADDRLASAPAGIARLGARLAVGRIDKAAVQALSRQPDTSSATTLYAEVAEVGGVAASPLAGGPLEAGCVGLNVFVRSGDTEGVPSAGSFTPYLMMAAHGIVAREGASGLWHVHLSEPAPLAVAQERALAESRMYGGAPVNTPCDYSAPPAGMFGGHSSFGPSFVGSWLASQPGLYALYMMAKYSPASVEPRVSSLFTPSFFFRIGQPPPWAPPTSPPPRPSLPPAPRPVPGPSSPPPERSLPPPEPSSPPPEPSSPPEGNAPPLLSLPSWPSPASPSEPSIVPYARDDPPLPADATDANLGSETGPYLQGMPVAAIATSAAAMVALAGLATALLRRRGGGQHRVRDRLERAQLTAIATDPYMLHAPARADMQSVAMEMHEMEPMDAMMSPQSPHYGNVYSSISRVTANSASSATAELLRRLDARG